MISLFGRRLPAIVLILPSAVFAQDSKTGWQQQYTDGCKACQQGDYPEAEKLLQRAATAAEKFGPLDPRLAQTLANLAWVAHKQGDGAKAESRARKARDAFGKAESKPDSDTTRALYALALIFQARKQYADAERLYEKALSLSRDEAVFGPAHPVTAQLLCDLGRLYDAQRKFAEADERFTEAGKMFDALPADKETARKAVGYEKWADHCRRRGDFARAAELQQKAVELLRGSRKPEEGDRVQAEYRLAVILAEDGRYADAEKYFREVLAVRQKQPAKGNLPLAQVLHDLGAVSYEQGKLAEAEDRFGKALEIREQALGARNVRVASTLHGLAGVYKADGKWAEAAKAYDRALKIREALQEKGKESPDLAADLEGLAGVYRKSGKAADAEPLLRRALAIREKAQGKEHRAVAAALHNLANYYREQGRFKDAEPLFQQALAMKEKLVGPDHPSVAGLLEHYAALLQATGRKEQADKLTERAKKIRKAVAE